MNTNKQTAVDWLYKTHFFQNGVLTQENFEYAKSLESDYIKELIKERNK